mmetsp:Transcript_48468/g.139379  ORF Transcript_48468/g.139379 Transcript_48468/m.139379 type:complete len:249 (-) Transcript_48468:567-1313(-)
MPCHNGTIAAPKPLSEAGASTNALETGSARLSTRSRIAVYATYSPPALQQSENARQPSGAHKGSGSPGVGTASTMETQPLLPHTASRPLDVHAMDKLRCAYNHPAVSRQPFTARWSTLSHFEEPCGHSAVALCMKTSSVATSVMKRRAVQPSRAKSRPVQCRAMRAGISGACSNMERWYAQDLESSLSTLRGRDHNATDSRRTRAALDASSGNFSKPLSLPCRKRQRLAAFIAAAGRFNESNAFASLK